MILVVCRYGIYWLILIDNASPFSGLVEILFVSIIFKKNTSTIVTIKIDCSNRQTGEKHRITSDDTLRSSKFKSLTGCNTDQ